MADLHEQSFNETIRSREEYEEYEHSVQAKRAKIENPSGQQGDEEPEQMLTNLDALYDEHARGSSNTVIIEADQRAFKNTVDVFLERMRNQARGVPGEMTVESFACALSEQAAEESGNRVLEKMGTLFSRGSKLAVLPLSLPTFEEVSRGPPRAPRFQLQRPPSGSPEAPKEADEDEFIASTIQTRIQKLILKAVIDDEAANNYEPLLLHRLCFDKESFVRTVENLFNIGSLIKEQRLWLGANKRGLPVIGSVRHRSRYIANHPSDDISGPDRNLNLASVEQQSVVREQFNMNFDYQVYELQHKLFGDEPTMVLRNDYDDEGTV